MSEKRFKVIDDNFSMWIVDTTLKEDKHEGAIYTAYDMCHKLNELYEENEQLKAKASSWKITCSQEINEKNVLFMKNRQLQEENERLKNKLNVTALELVDEAISMGKAVEISEMSYREFIDYRAENGKPMELQL